MGSSRSPGVGIGLYKGGYIRMGNLVFEVWTSEAAMRLEREQLERARRALRRAKREREALLTGAIVEGAVIVALVVLLCLQALGA